MKYLLFATAAAVLSTVSNGFKYDISHRTVSEDGDPYVQSAFIISEGGMYASKDGPLGYSGLTTIGLELTASLTPGARAVSDTTLNIHAAYVENVPGITPGLVRASTDGSDPLTLYCCTKELYDRGLCEGASVGGFIAKVTGGQTLDIYTMKVSDFSSSESKTKAASNHEVLNAGPTYVIIATCDADGKTATLPDMTVEINAIFRNPYGFLPGQIFGYLPFYGTLFALYLLLVLVYAVSLVRNRKYILRLQWLIFFVMILGALEMATWTLTYDAKNKSGIPTPCNVCPVTSDYIAAVVLNAAKRAISRVLLLAVCLGFGVVHPSLDRRNSLMIAALGVGYFIFGMMDDISKETSYDTSGPSTWELPVLLLELIFTLGIYGGFTKVRRDLTESKQEAKLKMYSSLNYVLVANIIVWFLFTCVLIGIRMRTIVVPWHSLFYFVSFWDWLYFAVLAAVAYIWSPGPSAYNYAWYSQGASNEGEAELEDDVEMVRSASPSVLKKNNRKDGSNSDVDNESLDDLEINIDLEDDPVEASKKAEAQGTKTNFAITNNDEDDDDSIDKDIAAVIEESRASAKNASKGKPGGAVRSNKNTSAPVATGARAKRQNKSNETSLPGTAN